MQFKVQVVLLILSVFAIGNARLAHSQVKDEAADKIAGSEVFRLAYGKPFKFTTFTLQNDLFVAEDDGYTNGVGFTYGIGPFLKFTKENTPGYLNFLTKNLYIQTIPNRVHGIAHMFFQRMQTPVNIVIPELQTDDLPYAGLAAVQSQLYSYDRDISDQFSLFLGFVGPAALAEQAQSNVHALTGSDRPLGWGNQLNNEPVFRVEARHIRKLYKNYVEGRGFDLLGIATGGVGNLLSDAQAGLAIRWGSNMEFTHATFSLQSDRHVNPLALATTNDYIFYLGAQLSFVANDILIDGNTFTDSHSVPLKQLQEQISGGILWRFGPVAFVLQITQVGPRTRLSSKSDNFGAFSLTFTFD